jgi:hypothetical protein
VWSLKGESISPGRLNVVKIQEIFHACSTIFIGLDTCIEKESESKTCAEKDKCKVWMYIDARDADI